MDCTIERMHKRNAQFLEDFIQSAQLSGWCPDYVDAYKRFKKRQPFVCSCEKVNCD